MSLHCWEEIIFPWHELVGPSIFEAVLNWNLNASMDYFQCARIGMPRCAFCRYVYSEHTFLLTPINHTMHTRQQCNIHTTIVARVWHAVCYLNSIYIILCQVFWKRLYKTNSSMEKGTLCQIRNLINRCNITNKPKDIVNAAEDFVELVTVSHILTAAMSYLGMTAMNDFPSAIAVPREVWMEDDDHRRRILQSISVC